MVFWVDMKNQRYNIRIRDSYYMTDALKKWLRDNGIKNYSWYTGGDRNMYISFMVEEDAMAFKLRWM